MMLGFVVRQCAVALGHTPTAEELARWANHQGEGRGRYCVFGRPITVEEARIILRHPARPVTVRDPVPQARTIAEPSSPRASVRTLRRA